MVVLVVVVVVVVVGLVAGSLCVQDPVSCDAGGVGDAPALAGACG